MVLLMGLPKRMVMRLEKMSFIKAMEEPSTPKQQVNNE